MDKQKTLLLNQHQISQKIKRIAFCCGKIYYDLVERRAKEGVDDIAFIRIEQLYPFPKKQVEEILKKYSDAKELMFVQEEPENMGAWIHLFTHLKNVPLKYIGRHESASPATGFSKLHAQQQQGIADKLFAKVLAK